MVSNARRFRSHDLPPEAARILFDNASNIEVHLSRGTTNNPPMLTFSLHGGFEVEDGNLLEIAQGLLFGFSQLHPVDPNERCDDGDE